MAQKPHASSVNKRKWKPKTYSTEDSDRVDLLCSPPRVQQWAPLEKLMENKRAKS